MRRWGRPTLGSSTSRLQAREAAGTVSCPRPRHPPPETCPPPRGSPAAWRRAAAGTRGTRLEKETTAWSCGSGEALTRPPRPLWRGACKRAWRRGRQLRGGSPRREGLLLVEWKRGRLPRLERAPRRKTPPTVRSHGRAIGMGDRCPALPRVGLATQRTTALPTRWAQAQSVIPPPPLQRERATRQTRRTGRPQLRPAMPPAQ